MELTHPYYFFKEAITPEICKQIIDTGLAKIEQDKKLGVNTEGYTSGALEKGSMPGAKPRGELTPQEVIDEKDSFYVRDSEVSWINDQWLYDLIIPYVNEANMKAGWNWEWDIGESFQFTVYRPNGFYSWHKDGGSDQPNAYKRYIHGVTPVPLTDAGRVPAGYTTISNFVGKVRKISVTINLNAPGDYEGGNLKFDFGRGYVHKGQFHECEEIRPQGSIIVFPSFLDHCVTPVTSGTRYSLVLWCLGKPFK
jgi:PKHD-type hydroxylase